MLLGRHADPDSTLATDPRSDPRMVAALAQFGLAGRLPPSGLSVDSPVEERHAFATMSEEGMGAVFDVLAANAPAPTGVSTMTRTITGVDGNDITIYVSRQDDATGPLPGVVHLHGGGMAIGSAADVGYIRLREALAATGLVVVGVEFRNSGGKLGPHPYPAGLNDCGSAAQWASVHRDGLGISHVIVSGESGGGNLTLTLAHKARREGWVSDIAGFYAQCPYISNRWLQECEDLPSLTENDGYFVSCEQLALLGSLYAPDGAHSSDAACWAAVASDDELEG
ncbi:alpha/beta hydrolase, partial [Mycobacterium sp. ITM-2017-0098]